MTTAIELERTAGGRIYLKGHTYAVREVLDAAGAIWCPVVRKWFVRDLQLAEDIRWALKPGKDPKTGKPRKVKLKVAVSALDHLRAAYRGTDIRCELCAAYKPGEGSERDMGSCPKGQAFRFGLCLDFVGVTN